MRVLPDSCEGSLIIADGTLFFIWPPTAAKREIHQKSFFFFIVFRFKLLSISMKMFYCILWVACENVWNVNQCMWRVYCLVTNFCKILFYSA